MICVVFHCTNRSNEVKHLVSALVYLVEILSRPPNNLLKEVLSRKRRAHCLNAVPDYWSKIAEHCRQILFPVIANCWLHMELERFQSISSRSLTRADTNGSGDIDISLGYRRRSSVSSSLNSYKTDTPKYYRNTVFEHNLKIGPLMDLHTRWHSSYFSSTRSSYKQ